jgi:hypothetical protein
MVYESHWHAQSREIRAVEALEIFPRLCKMAQARLPLVQVPIYLLP